jgi:hypothetical protein
LTTRTIAEIESEIAAHEAELARPDNTGPALQAELRDAKNDEAVKEAIVWQQSWLAIQSVEAARLQLVLGQATFLRAEAQAQLEKFAVARDELVNQANAADELVRAALTAGDSALAQRNAESSAAARLTLGHLPILVDEAAAHKAAAEADMPEVERDLASAEYLCRVSTAEIDRLENLPRGTPFDQPAPPAPSREIPSSLGFAGSMVLRQQIEETTKALTEPVYRFSDERQVKPARDKRDRTWKVGKLNKR